jgi:hypothetical protein
MKGMATTQNQETNRKDLLFSQMHAVSHLPFDDYFRQCVENGANQAYRDNTPVHDAEYIEPSTLAASGCVMEGDYLRIKDGFFRVDKVTESAGGMVLDIDDLCGGAFCVILAGTEN